MYTRKPEISTCTPSEISRECISCNRAFVKKIDSLCIEYSRQEKDSSCSYLCEKIDNTSAKIDTQIIEDKKGLPTVDDLKRYLDYIFCREIRIME